MPVLISFAMSTMTDRRFKLYISELSHETAHFLFHTTITPRMQKPGTGKLYGKLRHEQTPCFRWRKN
jgi:hypothetical protein